MDLTNDIQKKLSQGDRMPATPLEKCRLAKGWNREELSAAAGVSFRTIYRIEKRKGTPRRATVFVLATALGTTVADLTEADE